MKRSNIAIQAISNFPSWSEAKRNPISNVRVLMNQLGWQLDDIDSKLYDLNSANFLTQLDPLTEPYMGYVTPIWGWDIHEPDSGWYEALDRLPDRELTGIIGDPTDQTIPSYTVNIQLVDGLKSYLAAPPTDYYIETKLPIDGTNKYIPGVDDGSGNPITYTTAARIMAVVQNNMYIMLDYSDGDPAYIKVAIPSNFISGEMKQPKIYNGTGDIIQEEMGEVYGGPYTQDEAIDFYIDNGDSLTFEEAADPLIRENEARLVVEGPSKQILIGHFVRHNTITATNTLDGSAAIVTTEYTTTDYNTSKYKEQYDFNNDGIIDDYDKDELMVNIGRSSSNYSAEEWEEKYAKYDINGDGEIDNTDLSLFMDAHMSVKFHGTILKFDNNGIFIVKYKYIDNGMTEAIYDNNEEVAFLPTRDALNNEDILPLPTDWKMACYSPLLQSYLYLNKDEHKIVIIKYDTDLIENVLDKWAIYLPIKTGADATISMDVFGNKLYVLMKYDGKYVIVKYTLDDNFNDEYEIRYVHNNKVDKVGVTIKQRDQEGILDPVGIKVLSDDLMIVVDRIGNGFLNVKLIRGIYDYAMIDTFNENGQRALFTRERYDILKSGENILTQVYYHIWNRYDDFAFELGLFRMPGEGNINLRNRIYNYLNNYPDPSREMIEMEIHREFMIDDQAFIADHAIWGVSIWGTVTWG